MMIPIFSFAGAVIATLVASASVLVLRVTKTRGMSSLSYLPFRRRCKNPVTHDSNSAPSPTSAEIADDTTEKAANSSMLFEITPNQHQALLLSPHAENTSEFDEMFGQALIDQIRETFDREGVVLIRGLLDNDLLEKLILAGDALVEKTLAASSNHNTRFTSMEFGPLFLSPPPPTPLNATTTEEEKDVSKDANLTAFREVALSSLLPMFIAKVLLNNDPTQNLRVLKDAFLGKGEESNYCGWHVDDFVFWPTKATSSPPGVNAWIALDEIPSHLGGGLAVSPRSHRADWKQEAYTTIGSTMTHPSEGYAKLRDIGLDTCDLKTLNPKLERDIDETRLEFDFQEGDVLIHSRWIFHRSVPLTEEGVHHFRSKTNDKRSTEDSITQQYPAVVKRYSIRYEFGTATLLQGYNMETSLMYNLGNEGRMLNEVCDSDGPWYPQCWPNVDQDEMSRLGEIVNEKTPKADTVRMERIKELRDHFASM